VQRGALSKQSITRPWSRDDEVAERRNVARLPLGFSRFNGAATMRSRKEAAIKLLVAHYFELQWSRDDEVAESHQTTATTSTLRLASMEPRR
jgi:hypothetical protein